MEEDAQFGYRRALDTYVGLVKRTASFSAATGKLALRPVVWGLELPGRARPHIGERIRAERPRAEAKIALDAILRGRAHKDRQLIGAGETMLVKAVQSATTSRVVPEEVTEEVLQIAHDVHLDPEATYADPFVARHVQAELEQFDRHHSN